MGGGGLIGGISWGDLMGGISLGGSHGGISWGGSHWGDLTSVVPLCQPPSLGKLAVLPACGASGGSKWI